MVNSFRTIPVARLVWLQENRILIKVLLPVHLEKHLAVRLPGHHFRNGMSTRNRSSRKNSPPQTKKPSRTAP